MTSSTPQLNGEQKHNAWFQDVKSGCEKQAHYFERIQRLQHELICREQHNLISTMERLKQTTYPRKKPLVKTTNTSYIQRITPLQQYSEKRSGFPSRPHNLRKEGKFNDKAMAKKEKIKIELKPITGKPLGVEKSEKSRSDRRKLNFGQFLSMPLLSEHYVAKIVTEAQTLTPKTPSTYLLQPRLPSIPSVGRHANLVLDNRLKLLTLARGESDFNKVPFDITTCTHKRLYTSRSQWKPSRNKNKNDSDCYSESKDHFGDEKYKGKKNNMLVFDVDPNDRSLFSHCVDDSNVWENQSNATRTPLPPPNSRPNSDIYKSLEVHLDATELIAVDNDIATCSSPESADSSTALETEPVVNVSGVTNCDDEFKKSVGKDDRGTVQKQLTTEKILQHEDEVSVDHQ